MKKQTTTESVEFHDLDRRKVVARFDGGTITSDAGALLLRELDQATGILRDFTGCFTDHRNPDLIEHTVLELVAQRVYALALGYEDLNDHDELRADPLLATLVGKVDPTGQNRRRKKDRGKPLAGKSTLKSWSCERRVIGKAEHLAKGANPRFVVTSIPAEELGARELYEEEYCARGDRENRIKEQQLFLFADRTSTAFIWSNQIRLWFSSVAYTLLQYLRTFALEGTSLARAQCNTIRLKLLKIGALVKISVRRVLVSLAESYPYREIFMHALRAIRRLAFVSS